MPQSAPTAATLVEQFSLKEQGRERGRQELPPATTQRLDNPEQAVTAYCRGLFEGKRKEYNRHRTRFEERVITPGTAGTPGADADIEQTCLRLKQTVEKDRSELEGLARTAQRAIRDHHNFRTREQLTHRDAH